MDQLLRLSGVASYVGGFCAITVSMVLIVWYWRNEKKERHRLARNRTDIADMTILFNTMRDIITQQKALAREFNRELDRKTALVKQILVRSMEKNERLYEGDTLNEVWPREQVFAVEGWVVDDRRPPASNAASQRRSIEITPSGCAVEGMPVSTCHWSVPGSPTRIA